MPSRLLYDAIVTAIDSGYTEDDIRVAFWSAACIPREQWLKDALRGSLHPHILLRHKGGMNTQTGKEAKRWLDELTSRALENNPILVSALLKGLPEDMKAGERELLERTHVPVDGE